ncbi:hypothetical protein HZH68_000018 [Vespula germanica]|uniref:Carboxylesterase type B domain-containing protein n=1 Tax=Vespula germanica TaxID=30212 RepID=A0A834NSX6_VESGE|nr:hypothetical protein HZH68_000018 [Vespula germanica]
MSFVLVKKSRAAHADEIEMIFYSDLFQVNPQANNNMTLLQRRMTRLWTNFVKYGNPTPNDTNDALLNVVWPDSKKSGEMLWLNNDLSVHNRYKTLIMDVVENNLKIFGGVINGCNINWNKI